MNNRVVSKALAAFCALNLAAVTGFSHDIVQNGSFELPGFAGETGERLPSQQGAPIDNWAASAINIRWLKGDGVHYFTPNKDHGDYFINLDGYLHDGGTVSQDLATEAGTSYRVTFDINADFGETADDVLQVEVAGTTNIFSHTIQSNWQEQSFVFAASAPNSTLLFRNIDNSGSRNPYIDNVRVEAVPPPQPFVNGSFEEPGFEGETGEVLPAQQAVAITGWTPSAVNVRWLKGDGVYTFTPNRDHGDYFINLDGNHPNGGTISQTFDTVPGVSYKITFALNADRGLIASNILAIEIAGATNVFSHTIQSRSNWEEKFFTFTANNSSSTLLFRNIDSNGGRSPYIDNVRVEEATPPLMPFANGSFEEPRISFGEWNFSAGERIANSWVVDEGDVDVYPGFVAAHGTQVVDLNGEQRGSVSQTFISVANTNYTLSFAFNQNPDWPGVRQAEVYWNGSVVATLERTSLGWLYTNIVVASTGEVATLRFASLDSGSYGILIDDVSLSLGENTPDDPGTNHPPIGPFANGSFEEPGFEGEIGERLPSQQNAPIANWTASAINVRWLKGDGVHYFTPNKDHGDYFINLDGYLHNGGTVSQIFSTETGTFYRVTFDINADFGHIADNVLQVEVGGLTQVFSHSIESNWQEHSFVFEANAASAELLFRNIDNSGSRNPYVDNVRLEVVPPPQPFVNGSFEEPGFEGEAGEVLPAQAGVQITGWIPSSFNVRWLKGDGAHSFAPARHHGDYFINLDGNHPNGGTISQTFDTVPGTAYEVTFVLNADFGIVASNILQVEIAGTTNVFSHTVQSNWQEQSFTFTANDSSSTLLFRNIDSNGSRSPFIDNVRIEETTPHDTIMPFTNGSFEEPQISFGEWNFSAGEKIANSWVVDEGDVDVYPGFVAAHGTQVVDLNGEQQGSVSQTFTSIPNTNYTLRFAFNQNPDWPGVRQAEVYWNGSLLGTIERTSLGWLYTNFTVTSTGEVASLRFTSLNDGSYGILIDDVSLALGGMQPEDPNTNHPPVGPFINGSFEQPGFEGETGEVLPSQEGVEIIGWVTSDFNVRWLKGDGVHGFTPNRDHGDYFINLDGYLHNGGTVSQTFPTQPGALYLVLFDMNADFGSIATNVLSVEVAGTSRLFSHTIHSNWQENALVFRAADSTTTLLFRNVDNTGSLSPYIDHVRVELFREIQNGSFEIPVITSSDWNFTNGQTIGEAWIVDQGDVDVYPGFEAADGRQAIDLNGEQSGAIHQIISLTPGTAYTLSFAYASNPDSHGLRHAEVSWNDQSLTNLAFDSTGFSRSNPGWRYTSISLPLNSTNVAKLRFASMNSGSYGILIDDVRISTSTEPLVVAQPQSQTVSNGAPASFSVEAIGQLPFTYQWYFEETAIEGATSSTLFFIAGLEDQGYYSVIVSNSLGQTVSQSAFLRVLAEPVMITRHPASQEVVEGRAFSVSVAVTGSDPITYQWFKDGNILDGETNNFISLTASSETAGSYSVLVANHEGPVQSDPALITVVENDYSTRVGRYIGIFAEDSAMPATSGGIDLMLQDNGSYEMSVRIGIYSNSVPHFFDTNGVTVIAAGGRVPVTIDLDLEGSGFNELKGTVTGSNWTAQLLLEKVDAETPELEGTYTFALQGHADSDILPGGHSIGTLSISNNGAVMIGGSLADGTKIQLSSQVTTESTIPVYLPLYGKSGGTLVGWYLINTNTGTAELSGNLDWLKLPTTNGLYQAGFRFRTPILGAIYVAPTNARAINVTNGVWLAEGGNIDGSIGATFKLSFRNAIRFQENTNNVSLKISPDSGTFQGNFVHPQLGTTSKFSGVLLQGSHQFGLGNFVAGDEAGAIYIGE